MALDWSQCPAVESIPGKVSGAWVFKNTRMPVSLVFENLEAGASIRRNHGMASPHARADRDRPRLRGTKSRPAGSTRARLCFPGTCSFCLITARQRLCDTHSGPIRSSKLWSADGKRSRMEPCFRKRKPRALKFLSRRQEHPLPTELNEAKDRHSCPRKRAMAYLAPPRRSCRRCGERCHTWQLRRSPDTPRRLGQVFPTCGSKPCGSPELKRTFEYICLACRSLVQTRASPYNHVHASA